MQRAWICYTILEEVSVLNFSGIQIVKGRNSEKKKGYILNMPKLAGTSPGSFSSTSRAKLSTSLKSEPGSTAGGGISSSESSLIIWKGG